MVFGFATKEEKKRLKSLSSSNEYCTGKEQLTDIQFFIEHNSSFNFQIPRQMILTPYSIPCTEIYKFHISLNINNGKNHLDYRYQNLQIASIVFFSLYIITSLTILLYCLFAKVNNFINNFFLIFFLLLSSFQSLIIYFECESNKNYEFIPYDRFKDNYVGIFCFGMILAIYAINAYNLSYINTNTDNNKYILSVLAILVIDIVLLIIYIFIDRISNSLTLYIIFHAFYFLLAFLNIQFSSNFSRLGIAALLIILNGYFFTVRYPVLKMINYKFDRQCIYNMFLYITNWTLVTISIILVLINFFCFRYKKDENWYTNLDEFEKIKNNYSDDFQRNNDD